MAFLGMSNLSNRINKTARERTISSGSTRSQNAYLGKENFDETFVGFIRRIMYLLFTVNTPGFFIISALIFVIELILCVKIVWLVPYTEIDWLTYMQQVKVYMKGEKNYSKIDGDTGPLVYPAGHLVIFKILFSWTNNGQNIRLAQYIYVALYLVNLALVFRLFFKSRRIPPFVLILISLTSIRIHSIFLLRLFNDPIAMLIFFGAVNLWISQQWFFGCILYSLAVSVKMNILLFAPALFFILLLSNKLDTTFFLLLTCALIQIFIASDFLLYDPFSYINKAFEFGRIFFFKWTVNWRFLPEEIFLNKKFHYTLLVGHLVILILFMTKMWFRSQGGLISLLRRLTYGIKTRLDVHEILYALFTANLIGIAFARSLHYQFYCWYYHSLAYLLFSTIYSPVGPNDEQKSWSQPLLTVIPFFKILTRVVLLMSIEYCWNTYPSTCTTSALLHFLHISIMFLLVQNRQRLPCFIRIK